MPRQLLGAGPLALAHAVAFTGASAAAQGLGGAESRSTDGTDGIVIDAVLCMALPLMLAAGLFFLLRVVVRGAAFAATTRHWRQSQPSNHSVEVSSLDKRLHRVAIVLTSVEHALRLEEDSELREMLDQSTLSEQRARDEVDKARAGKVSLPVAAAQVHAAEESMGVTEERARELFGDNAFLDEGARVGCFFCARPLANASYRRQVPLKRGSDITPVVACPPCAELAAAGQPSPILVRMEMGERMLHWSELERYDPYHRRHEPYPGVRTVPAWDLASQLSLSELAARAAGGQGELAADEGCPVLDLDSPAQGTSVLSLEPSREQG